MALSSQQIRDAIGGAYTAFAHGPARLERACLIARDGIIPGSDLERSGLGRAWSGFQASRDGFVYLGSPGYISDCVSTAIPIFSVDLTELEPKRLSCDEDHVSIYRTIIRDEQHYLAELLPEHFHVRGDLLTWRRGSGFPRPQVGGDRRSQGQWANTPLVADWLARDEFVAASITLGSVCHAGKIAPTLLSIRNGWWREEIGRFWGVGHWKNGTDARSALQLISIASMLGLLAGDETERERMLDALVYVNAPGPVLANLLRYYASSRDAALEGCERVERVLADEAAAAAA